jgi:thiol-disulfide isomerase/thioredoxin
VKRNLLVSAAIVVFIALLVWAGVHNLRRRHEEAAKIREQQLTVVADGKTQGGATASASGSSEDATPDLRGKEAAGFSLVALDGKKFSLKDYKGKPVLVNFWATWCAPCKVEMPWFEEFHKKYAGDGLQVVGITEDADAGKDEISKAVQKTGATYPILLTDNKVDKAYGDVEVLPMSFYIGRDGKIVTQTAGLGTKDEVEANLKKIISGGE